MPGQATKSIRRLRFALMAFFLAASLPTAFLIWKTYDQLRFESFYQFRQQAEALTQRVDSALAASIEELEGFGFADFSFLVVEGDPAANFLQRSDLSMFPVNGPIPGLIGYFQVDAAGDFSTPLLPVDLSNATRYGLSAEEQAQRRSLADLILNVLSDNELVERSRQVVELERNLQMDSDQGGQEGSRSSTYASAPAPVESVPVSEMIKGEAQARFDDLASRQGAKAGLEESLEQVESGALDALSSRYEEIAEAAEQEGDRDSELRLGEAKVQRGKRREQTVLPGRLEAGDDSLPSADRERRNLTIRTFSSEIDPFSFSLLDSGHLVLFRNVWREGQRFIQGAVIDQAPFVRGGLLEPFENTQLFDMSRMVVAYQDRTLALAGGDNDYRLGSQPLQGSLLYRSRLTAPLDNLELLYTINYLPAGPGANILGWVSALLFAVLFGGSFLMYRLGKRQISLAQQQQDFVSAVSHELKTPLTSIRMYGEMLVEGWASDEKKQTYYEYIFDESERLSRLIANVLQLARLNRDELDIESKPISVRQLMDLARSKVTSQAERAGFDVAFECDEQGGETLVLADEDAFCQVVINLVDNAIKFADRSDVRRIDVKARARREGGAVFSVRDFGPGIPKDQMKKIFRLFYRAEDEMTRETVGTGIGLALVDRLVRSMGGTVDVLNVEPGAEFRIWLTPE